MTTIVILGLIVSAIIYISVGFANYKKTKSVGDMMPLVEDMSAHVRSSREFSASTAATSISLVTVIMFFFESVAGMGPYLIWSIVTTLLGLLFVYLLINKIWNKINEYEQRPSLHDFIGLKFHNKNLTFVGAFCTSISYLATYAVETYVGSIFLHQIMPNFPLWVLILMLTLIGFIYTLSGFRTVIITDVIQMGSIFLFCIIIIGTFVYYYTQNDISISLSKIPENIISFNYRPGLIPFLSGLFVINICMFIVSMSLFQRIAACNKSEIKSVKNGIKGSMLQIGITWTIFLLGGILLYSIFTPVGGKINPLTELLKYWYNHFPYGRIILFFSVLGLFGALLSTASTNLSAVTQSIYDDIINTFRNIKLNEKIVSKNELILSRFVLFCSSALSMLIIAFLYKMGYSITDMAFIVYGGQLSLFAPVILSILIKEDTLRKIGKFSPWGVGLGMLGSWSMAVFGKLIGNGDIVLLSPVASLLISFIVLLLGHVFYKAKYEKY